jgi:6-phosphogluconolactonase (cycloisomerase 2 family)
MDGNATGIGWLDDDGYRAVTDAASPSFLTLHPTLPVLYAVLEHAGRLEAYRVDGPGALAPIGGIDLGGGVPCHIGITADRATVACYGDGRVITVSLHADGRPERIVDEFAGQGSGPHPNQANARAHSSLELDGLVLVADLGSDLVRVFRRDGDALRPLTDVELPAGSGPRDLALHPSGRVLVLTELDPLLATLSIDGDRVELVASVPVVSEPVAGDAAAGLAITADGRFATAGLRGSDRIALVALDADGLVQRPLAALPMQGSWPRHHVLVDGTVWVTGQLSDGVERMTAVDGALAADGEPVAVPSPTLLLPANAGSGLAR